MEININDLPDSVLLKIFCNLTFKERQVHTVVCRRWYNIINDPSLLKVVYLTNGLAPHQFRKLLLTSCSADFQELSVDGQNKVRMSRKILKMLQGRCQNLKTLCLSRYVFKELDLDNFPHSVVHLCFYSGFVYEGIRLSNASVNLRCLDLSLVLEITSEDMRSVNRLTSLTCLYLQRCIRINDKGIELLKDILPQLQVLDLEGTDISNTSVILVLETCANIKQLFLGHNQRLCSESFYNFNGSVKLPLKKLCIAMTSITLLGIKMLAPFCQNFEQLEVVNSCVVVDLYISNLYHAHACEHFSHHHDYCYL